MGLYYDGYAKSREQVFTMSDAELLAMLDDLYGRENLPKEYSHDELLAEALGQHKREWTDTQSPEYEQVQFWTGIAKLTLAKH